MSEREGATEPREVENVHPYVFNDPVRAIREALRVIEADRTNLFAEVERLSAAVYQLQGPM